MSNDVLDKEALSQISKLIDSSSFGSDAVVDLSRRARPKDVVAVCAAAEQHESTGPAFPCPPAEPSNDIHEPRAALGRPPATDDLVAAAVAGDPHARERLLAGIHPLVLRYCRSRLGRAETVLGSADDVAQEVCLAVVAALPGYTMKGLSFRAFVYGIAAHKVTDTVRAIGRNRADPTTEVPDQAIEHYGPEQRVLAGELAERLGGLLHTLTPQQREVLVLRICIGLSAEETAAAVGSTPGGVRVIQHRALNRLRGLVTSSATPESTQLEPVKWWHDSNTEAG